MTAAQTRGKESTRSKKAREARMRENTRWNARASRDVREIEFQMQISMRWQR
jgi:hypothetical protein